MKWMAKGFLMLMCMPLLMMWVGANSLPTFLDDTSIYSNDPDTVLNSSFVTPGVNPLRQGASQLADGVDGNIVNPGPIDTFDDASVRTLDTIQMAIDYVLGLLSLIALIYLIVKGIAVLTGANDPDKYKEAIKGLRTAIIALAGIGVSWLIVTFIFSVLTTVTS